MRKRIKTIEDPSPSRLPGDPPLSMRALIVMRAYSLLGLVLLAVGIIGVWVPILPSTIFFIGAAACFARSSPRLHAYLIRHPQFGPPLQHWFDEGAISKRGKAAALWGMGLGMAIVVLTIQDLRWVGLAAIIILASGWYVMSRPLPADDLAQDAKDAARMRASDDDRPPR
ncbi:MAG: YbaN family protein [Hyphomicrobiales bacterium]